MILRVGRGRVSVLYLDSCAARPAKDLAGRPVDADSDLLMLGTWEDCADGWSGVLSPATLVYATTSTTWREPAACALMPLAYGETATFALR